MKSMKGHGRGIHGIFDPRQAGFTLIELMLVMAVILILTGGAVGAYLNFNKSQTMMNDARNLATEIYRVRTLASTLQYPTGCTSLKGYTIQSSLIAGDLSGVIVTATCEPSDVASLPVKLLIGSVFEAPFQLSFLPGSGYLGSATEQAITIQSTDDLSVSKIITVGIYGTVTDI